jgi:hypothetical protein
MPKPTVFFEPYTDTIKLFVQEHNNIVDELAPIDVNIPIIPIYGLGIVKSTKFPFLYDLMRAIPYVRYAGIINIKPKFEQCRVYGYDQVANHTIRHFYTVKQSAANKSGIWIDGEKRLFSEKEWILGDMSREHSLFNKSKDSYTTIIFIDIDRHTDILTGRSPNSDIKKDEVLKVFEMDYNTIQLTQTDTDSVINDVDD